VDDKLTCLKPGQKKDQEITAKFSDAVIAHLMSYKIPLGNIWEYIENYSFRELVSWMDERAANLQRSTIIALSNH
jgi:hypothetical protein